MRSPSRSRWSLEHGHSKSDTGADLLPKVNGASPTGQSSYILSLSLSRRYTKVAMAFIIGLVTLTATLALRAHYSRIRGSSLAPTFRGGNTTRMPPDWARFREYEIQSSERHGDGPGQKYIFMANHARNSGWGNVMQDLLYQALLAYSLNRTFVYYNYTWRDDGSQYSYYNGKPIPSTIPLSALVAGPIIGASPITDQSAPQPFAVSEDYYRRICPVHERRFIRTEEVSGKLGHDSTARTMIGKWVELFGSAPEKCIEIPIDAAPNFDIFVFGDAKRLLDAWPTVSQSPILTEFAWSPLIELAFEQNREIFSPSHILAPPLCTTPLALSSTVSPSASRYSVIPGLLAIHLRRGDFEEHCKNLARWGSSYVGHNEFPDLLDKFHYPPDTTDDDRIAMQQPHCFPTISEIVQRAVEERATQRAQGCDVLVDVFIMTNGPREWVEELKDALRAADGWRSVSTSRDLEMNWEQRFVKQNVDMLIGQRAQVFVGNGYSSMSGLVTMFRMANGISPSQNRLF